MLKKFCSKCKIEKDANVINFPPHNKKRDGLDSWCKKCRATYRSQFRRGNYRSMISDENLQELLRYDKCMICNTQTNKIVIDHCHSKNKVRGVLCSNCNLGLGHFKDNVTNLANAIAYLTKEIK